MVKGDGLGCKIVCERKYVNLVDFYWENIVLIMVLLLLLVIIWYYLFIYYVSSVLYILMFIKLFWEWYDFYGFVL